ncbi:lactonase family protein [Nocardia alni]|uniref:lactonase family protein n=1 Tax=Nocardia alni TaxID=2815723 RepID=UPI001C2220B6|nr:lactonase family protein [Nocardia alni]
MDSKRRETAGRYVGRRGALTAGVTGGALLALAMIARQTIGSGAPTAAGAPVPTGEPTYVYVCSNSVMAGTQPGNPIGITVFRLDSQSGALTQVQQLHTTNPDWLAIDPSGRFLFATYALMDGTQNVGAVEAYTTDPRTGTLTFVNRVSLGNTSPAQIAVAPDGRHVVVANYNYGQYVVLPVGEDGRLGPVSSSLQDTGKGPNPRQDSAHPHAVDFDPKGRFLGAADLGTDQVQIFRLSGGQLERVSEISTPAGMGPRHVAFSPDSRTLYVIGELDGNIMAFAYNSETGAIGPALQTISTAPPGYSGVPSGSEIAVHPSGNFVYGANRGSQSVAGYRIDHSTGKLSTIGFATQGVNVPTNFAIDPSGRWLYVNSNASNSIVQFGIDPSGELKPTGRTTPLYAPNVMIFRAS